MNDILDLIKSRRTVKYFLPKFVSWENIARIVDAGRHAPSCGNIQNWKFIVCIESGAKQAVAGVCGEQYEIVQAGALIVVCNEVEKAQRYYGKRGEQLFSIQNCAAAIENMLLEATSLGLGSRWVGAFDEEEVKKLLNIPDEVRPQAIVAIGYAKDVPPKPAKYPLETVVYFHKWRRKMRDPAKYMNDIASILARKAESAKEKMQDSARFVVDKVKENLTQKKEDSDEE
ncbi:MAG: nitroreductase family protein [Nanoarchaeota archaeon]|nr:nitroreductase family protein [Nanoarchaeota archaeon]